MSSTQGIGAISVAVLPPGDLGHMHPLLVVGLKNYRVPGVVLKVLCILFKDSSHSPWQVLLIASLYRLKKMYVTLPRTHLI